LIKTILIIVISFILCGCYTIFPPKPKLSPEILKIINTPINDFTLNKDIIVTINKNNYKQSENVEIVVRNQTIYDLRIPRLGGIFVESLKDSIWKSIKITKRRVEEYPRHLRLSEYIYTIKPSDSIKTRFSTSFIDDQKELFQEYRIGILARTEDKHYQYTLGNYSESFTIYE